MSKKKVLAILSEYGYWGIELVGPLNKLEAAGYTVDFMTPNGKPADALPPSFDSTYVDPPLGVCVTTKQHEDDVKAFIAKNRTSTPLSLKACIPERPYYSATNFLRNLEQYYTKVKESVEFLTSEYDALFVVGGSGPIVDLVNNQ
ncbi:MAG: type 1 glutamine amidotransferase domain-containing protein, partial [Chlorobium sp.]